MLKYSKITVCDNLTQIWLDQIEPDDFQVTFKRISSLSNHLIIDLKNKKDKNMWVFPARNRICSFISRDENKEYHLVYGGVIALLLSSCRQPSMIKWVQGALSFSDRQKELWCLVATNAYISSLFWRDVIFGAQYKV